MTSDIQLIYLSDLAPGQEHALPSIVETSVRRNGADDITGMLLYTGGNIMQVLEGPAEAVHRTFARIGQDPRHRNITLVSEEPITERDFPDWRMAYKHLDPGVLQSVPQFAPLYKLGFKADAIAAKPGVARDMLLFFGRNG